MEIIVKHSEKTNFKWEALPRSKSYTNRYLILAACSKSLITLKNYSHSTDCEDLVNSLSQIGLDIDLQESVIQIKNSFPACEKNSKDIRIRDGGATLRFLLALLALGQQEYNIYCDPSLFNRPHDELLDSMSRLGVRIKKLTNGFRVKGPMRIEKVKVSTENSTQYATALSMVNPLVEYSKDCSSSRYLDLTEHCKSQMTKSDEVEIPIDWSSFAFPLVFRYVVDSQLIETDLDSFQADSVIYSICQARSDQQMIDVSKCLDLFPVLCFLAAYTGEVTKLIGLSNLAYKESDRLSEMLRLLDLFKVKYVLDSESLSIYKSKRALFPISFNAPSDHRIIMTAYLFMRYNSGGVLNNIEHVKKSFPNFFKFFGEKVEI